VNFVSLNASTRQKAESEKTMSMYGDGSYNTQMNNLYDEMRWFLEDHPVSELIQIVADAVKDKTESE